VAALRVAARAAYYAAVASGTDPEVLVPLLCLMIAGWLDSYGISQSGN
jgi:hypothetical protein